MSFSINSIVSLILGFAIISCNTDKKSGAALDYHTHEGSAVSYINDMQSDTLQKVLKTEEEWKSILTAEEYRILRRRGTELPFVNKYWNNKKEGIYYCAACGLPLYSSEHKYKSGTGWPSFWQPLNQSAVEERVDSSLFMVRTEIVCARCDSHLGHVFEDGPKPTGLRYCMNSLALDFKPLDEIKEVDSTKSFDF